MDPLKTSVEQHTSPVDIRDLIWRLRRNFWLIALPSVAVLCGAILYLKATPSQYESYLVVSVGEKAQVSAALEPLVRSDQARDQPRERAAVLDSRIHSRPFLLELGQRLGLSRSPELLAAAKDAARSLRGITPEEYASNVVVLRLGGEIRVAPTQGTLIRISATDPDPAFAMRLASAVGELLLEESKRSTLERAQARTEFSTEQIAVYQERLRKSEAALRSFQESMIGKQLANNAVGSQNVDQARLLAQEAGEEIAQIRGRIRTDQSAWQARGAGSWSLPDLHSATTVSLEARLRQLEVSYGMASLGSDATAANLALIKSKIGETRQTLLGEYEALARSAPGSLTDDASALAAAIALDRSILRSLREKKDRLDKMISDYTQGLVSSPRTQMELERLQSEVATNRDLLLTLRKEATSSRISEALGVSQLGLAVSIVEPAVLPMIPSSPDRNRILGVAVFLGPLLAIGLMIGMERFGAVVRTPSQAQVEIGAPVIGTIPRIVGLRRPGSVFRNHWPAMAVALVVLVTGIVIVAQHAAGPRGRPSSASSGSQP